MKVVKVLGETESEGFLKKEGFPVVENALAKTQKEAEKIAMKLGWPIAMKITSEKPIHKSKQKGVITGIDNKKELQKAFNKLSKKSKTLLLQKQIHGKEIFIGLKHDRVFGYVLLLGQGGISVEEYKSILKIFPIKNIDTLLKEAQLEDQIIAEIIAKIIALTKKFSIKELDINPLILGEKAQIVDARIIFD